MKYFTPIAISLFFSSVTLVAQLPMNLGDPTTRYVSTTGKDVNGGTSWGDAKATVAAAINSLPATATGPSIHFGTIYIGAGLYVETATPIEFNANIHLVCGSSGVAAFGPGSGSVIQLGNYRNTPLFSYTPTFAAANGYAHFLQIDGCTLDGNSSMNPSAPALVRMYNGGFQNTFRNVAFQNSNDYALRIDNQAVNFSCYSCTFGGNLGNGGAFYLNDLIGANVVSFYDTQIDNSGVNPIFINQTNGDTGGSNILTFVNLKTEATLGRTNHQHVIDFVPRPGGGGNPFNISIVGMTAINMIGSGDYAIYEANEPGYGANWEITGVNVGGYKGAFLSAKTGQKSAGAEIKHLVASVPYNSLGSAYQYTPDLELSGGPALLTGTGSPQGHVAANVGALFLRIDGGSSSTLYVKESGTGVTGWAAK
jgi:hypothetical protein